MRLMMLLSVLFCATLASAGDDAPFKAPQKDDYAAAMKPVAAKFKGTQGVYLHIGDSITYANQNTAWTRGGQGHSPAAQAFLKWSHNGDRNQTDGWWLASNDQPNNRSHTAASGMRANECLAGGKGGLPALSEIIKKYNPQMALYMLGTNDINGGRKVTEYIADVEKAIDMLLENGTIPILSTLPPMKGKAAQIEEYCTALRSLAAKKKIPLLDLNAEMKARAGDQMETAFLGGDGVHLSFPNAGGPATDDNLKQSGYLLRCYMAVYKGMEVKTKVIDAK